MQARLKLLMSAPGTGHEGLSLCCHYKSSQTVLGVNSGNHKTLQIYKELIRWQWWNDFQDYSSKITWTRGSQGQGDRGVPDRALRGKSSLRPDLCSVASTF